MDTDRSVLANMKTAAPQLNDTDVRKVLGSFLFSGDDVEKPGRVLSGGEKTRLALAMLVVSSANVLLLDEPTNNLDPVSRAEVLGAIRRYRGPWSWSPTTRVRWRHWIRIGCCCCPTAPRICGAPNTPNWSRSPEDHHDPRGPGRDHDG